MEDRHRIIHNITGEFYQITLVQEIRIRYSTIYNVGHYIGGITLRTGKGIRFIEDNMLKRCDFLAHKFEIYILLKRG